nr:HNH endonuclease family protein [Fructobacillus parabroussonetiae]
MNDLDQLISLWAAVNNHVEISDKEWSKNNDIRILLDVLSSYPNEFWKYPVVIFYLKYQNETYFENKFLAFLKKLAATLSAKYIITPTINAVKVGILNLNANIIDSPDPQFNFSAINLEDLREYVKTPHKNIVRMILKMIAYQHQDNLLPDKWEIEHIMPQKWQTNYFPNDTDVNIQSLVEHIGNKIPFEKKLNIVASNGYFKKKQDSYNQSNIQIVKKLSQTKNSWGLDNIHERDVRVTDELVDILNNWGLNSN